MARWWPLFRGPVYRKPADTLDPTRPIHEPTTFVRGQTSGEFLYLIAKVQAGLPLTPLDRDIIVEALRGHWLTDAELKDFKAVQELRQYEIARDAAHRVVPQGQREEWVETLYGKPRATLAQFMWRMRNRLR